MQSFIDKLMEKSKLAQAIVKQRLTRSQCEYKERMVYFLNF